jgi:fluoride exporter
VKASGLFFLVEYYCEKAFVKGISMMIRYLLVGLGGAIGSIVRVALEKVLPSVVLGIPVYILCVNVLGCLFIGLLTELLSLYWAVSVNMRYFLVSGLLGGFTTFSAFALEFGVLFEKQEYGLAVLYATLSVVLSVIFFFVGIKIVRFFN